MKHDCSHDYFAKAKEVIPGGVNSPVRAFKSVGCDPLFIERAEGSRIYDADHQSYIDYVGSWGPMILGHCHPEVVRAIQDAAVNGASFGAPTYKEIELAEMVCEAYPNIEKVRMVSSGTEATMSAIRLARGCTGRDKILKFDGCYHGHADSLLVKAGSGAATFGVPTSPGIPADFAKYTLTATYNDLDEVKSMVAANKNEIACIILEPIAGNMGCVPPQPGFLEGLRELCTAEGIVLIIDEVMTGFRVAFGGAQERFNVRGDLVCLGKIIGGGLPVGAFGGKKELMDQLSPEGGIYQAGTLSGNPLAMSAGIATLKLLKQEGFYEQIEEKSAYLEAGLRQAASKSAIPTCLQRVGGMFCTYFCEGPVNNFSDASKSDTEAFSRYFRTMLDSGINMAPSQFEAGFMSVAHTKQDLDQTIEAAEKAFALL
ncbi:glutamate-1-semialdehyde 2,1-aminomutase [Desulfuromonas acetoxidans]|uniref:Glutamate-1-semialdehyde 2,1-aminomutase n=1 Tax=Desulfuromonas acetoxidans (strain DSM 684 / 11070) TaxID=281689 RepID=Q1K4D9_DESA6|nr:glutamate-1-semialdehyde 2,1-aminomutase [Desulfuromonas acetoxidans]EAT17164.1 glutamate-1-semialdehyde-2,1-aminomutase [Desulfuromonas acetoxidans DSM 684]MBF0646324.1 glutamate-1-semialdehyde 2,1-aminomutase [Desulfuromonas acetoxidans]NVD24249.1 glutamate-1-semialdehyde 2,1-aminomutase [Desulfuromonas acetoxidans]NVE14978.1 glutamate-1-semialdehyde 2,1-aminomutase [Desulfuromonas acetoxidans]